MHGEETMKSTAILLMALAGAFVAAPALAQPDLPKSAQAYHAPRNAFGQPDLEGVWSNATLTKLERDPKYGTSLAMPIVDAAAVEKDNAKFLAEDSKPTDPKLKTTDLPDDCGRGYKGGICGYPWVYTDPGTEVMAVAGQKRTSIIVEPANGRLPPLTAEARKRVADRFQRSVFDGPEVRPLGERCISIGPAAGPPMVPTLYNNNHQIYQTKDTVTIVNEMVHDTRIIHLNTGHLPVSMKQWMGDSVGHWEGDTLVVETTNMRPEEGFNGAGGDTKVVERFTRIGPHQILYRFTVNSPEAYSAPITGEEALNASKATIYEYACHEGNYSLPTILAGARELEKQGRNPGSDMRTGLGLPAEEGP
jgi:hypothetical protein